jgi:hypothetical protein
MRTENEIKERLDNYIVKIQDIQSLIDIESNKARRALLRRKTTFMQKNAKELKWVLE